MVREAVEGAVNQTDPADDYYEALADYPEEADRNRYHDLAARADRRMINAR